MYLQRDGEIVERYPDRYLIISPITIETMPMLHFQPRGKFLQISTVGCNLDCPGCISTVIVKEMDDGPTWLQRREPSEIIEEAKKQDCLGISFLMNDPLASWPTFVRIARKAKENHLLVGCSTNAFFTERSLSQVLPDLDFINVGIKGLSDQAYQQCGARSAKPVWRNIAELQRAGVHVEISCMYRKNEEAELIEVARRIADISPDIPLQVMRFIPMEKADPAWETTIKEAEDLCLTLRDYLNHVYLFNSPGTEQLNTCCPECGKTIIERDFYGPMGARLKACRIAADDGIVKCALCGMPVLSLKVKTKSQTESFREADFQGGYPFTRALEILESIAIATGLDSRSALVNVWSEYADRIRLQKLHHDVQKPEAFLALIRSIGKSSGHSGEASELAAYIEAIRREIEVKSRFLENRPRVYYAMGKPLFAIKGERMENQLVEEAGGISVNRKLEISGRPGETITLSQLNELNPEIMFISAFIGSSVEDFYEACLRAGVSVEAVKNRKIYAHPAPGWDFGSPRWILGLMHIANVLHPEIFRFDVLSEAAKFYRKFYQIPFIPGEVNRSFGKPSSAWNLGNREPGRRIA
jgi:pyruvate-formate lyase-activating enzyme